MDRQLFSIGEMARLFQLSVSSIRHYEALGLLTPEYVDPATSYRYYGPRQFEVFNTIRYLRALDMPLEEIADFLHNRDVDKIEEKLRVQKEAVAQKQRHLARIERKIDAQLQRLHDAQVSPLGEIELSTSRLAAAQAEAVIFLGKVGFGISLQHLQAQRYEHYDGVFLLLDEADRFDGDAMLLPAAPCVRVRFRGHHLQSPEQYRRLTQYMQANSLEICGFSREITIIDQGLTNDTEKFVTEITIPVRPK